MLLRLVDDTPSLMDTHLRCVTDAMHNDVYASTPRGSAGAWRRCMEMEKIFDEYREASHNDRVRPNDFISYSKLIRTVFLTAAQQWRVNDVGQVD